MLHRPRSPRWPARQPHRPQPATEAMARPIRKAVFPVAGLGTRFLPATKAVPKEMLPVVDRPLIDYAVAEAAEAGASHMIFVTAEGRTALEDHFDRNAELEEALEAKGKSAELERLAAIAPEGVRLSTVRQPAPLGLGHAVRCARHLVGDEPFAVILPDDLVMAQTPCLAQMAARYAGAGGNLLAVQDVPRAHTGRYGILDVGADEARPGGLVEVRGLVEKPAPEAAPSTLSIIGRYILQPEIFQVLESGEPGAGGEIQLTDAIAALIGRQPVNGFRFEGRRFDCGDRRGWLSANVAFALDRPDLPGVRESLRDLLDPAARPENTGGAE